MKTLQELTSLPSGVGIWRMQVFWIFCTCLSASATPQNPSQPPSSRGSCWSIRTSPSTPWTFWSPKGHQCSQDLSPYSTKGLAFIGVVRSTVYLHCLKTEKLSISTVKPCTSAIHKTLFSCSHRLQEWKIFRVMPLNIYQTARFTPIMQFP